MPVFDTFLAPLRGRCFSVLGGLCLLAVSLVGVPKSADASCGDYLAHPQHPMMAGHPAMNSPAKSDGPIVPPPCHGPSCRRSDAPMPVPTPAPTRLIGERWAAVLEFDVVLPTATTLFPALAEEVCLSALPARLDRPPKIG